MCLAAQDYLRDDQKFGDLLDEDGKKSGSSLKTVCSDNQVTKPPEGSVVLSR